MKFFKELRRKYAAGTLPVKFIFINVALFLVVRIVEVICTLFDLDFSLVPYLELPSDLTLLFYRPYTVVSYMFFQYGLLHLLFNMLWLYWFGQLFLRFFNAKQFGGLYFLGGFGGAALYLAAYNLLPYFIGKESMLLGASAAVLAIVFAVSAYAPDYKIRLFLIGDISLKYIALVTVVLDLLSVTSLNAGGHVAHIGGALTGWLFAARWRSGKDITRGINRFIDYLAPLFRPRRKKAPSASFRRPLNDEEYRRQRQENITEIDRILDKIRQSGYEALTAEEKKRLFDAGKK